MPSSGKSTAAAKLAKWLEEEVGKKVELLAGGEEDGGVCGGYNG